MHNFSLSPTISGIDEYNNRLTLERCVNAAAYNYWIPAKMLDQSTLVAVMPTFYAGGRSYEAEPAHWEFPDIAGTCRVMAYVRRQPQWLGGSLFLRAHIGCDTTTGNIVIAPVTGKVYSNVAPTTTVNPQTKTVPSVANSIIVSDLRSTNTNSFCTITPDVIGVVIGFERRPQNAADTCTGDLRLYGLELVYVERTRNLGGKFVEQEAPLA